MVTTKFRDRAAGPTFGDRSALKWDKEVYSEDILTTAVSVSAVTAVQNYLEALPSFLIISASSLQDFQAYVETVSGVIGAIDNLTDAQVYVQTLLDQAISSGAGTEIQSYLHLLSDVAQSASSLQSLQTYVEAFATIGFSTAAVDDSLVGFHTAKFYDRAAGPAWGERVNLLWDKVQPIIEILSDEVSSTSMVQAIQNFIYSLLTTAVSVSTVTDTLIGPRELKFFDRPDINEWENRLNFEWDKYQTFEENLSSVAIGVSSINDVQNYIGMIATIISSIDTLTDRQTFVETLAASVIQSVSAIIDTIVGAMEEILTSIAVSSASVVDQKAMIDSILSTVQSLSTLSDKQIYVQNLTSLIASGAIEIDLQQYVHTIQDMIVSGSSITDTIIGAMEEILSSVIISSSFITDQKTMVDNLLSVAQSLSELSDKQAYVHSLISLIMAGATDVDLQQYIHMIQDAIVSGSSVSDWILGPTYEYLLSTIVSRAGVDDYYKKAGMAEAAITFYMAARKDFQINARSAAFTIEKKT